MEARKQGRGIAWSTILIVLTLVVLWGSAFAAIRMALGDYSPGSMALLRYLVASAALGVYALITKMPLPRRQDWPGIAGLGFLAFALYSVALNAGEQVVPAATASLIIATAPAIVALLAVATGQESLRAFGWVGIALSFTGIAIMSMEPGQGLAVSWHALLVLVSAIAAAFYTVWQRPYLERYGGLQFATYAMWAGTVTLLPFLPALVGELPQASSAATWSVVFLGVFPGAIGYICWSLIVSRMAASRAGTFLYLVPVAAALVAWLWLGEVPGPNALIGGILALGGVILVNRLRRAK